MCWEQQTPLFPAAFCLTTEWEKDYKILICCGIFFLVSAVQPNTTGDDGIQRQTNSHLCLGRTHSPRRAISMVVEVDLTLSVHRTPLGFKNY